jgi:predicted dehydrogenase
MRPIRVGLVGPGRIARELHVPNLRAVPGVEVAAVAGSTPASARVAAAELGIPRAHADWQELVADPELDAVVVATWPFLHAPITVAALEAGKHVLCQARMATDGDEAQRMLDAARARPKLSAMVVPSPITPWADAAVRRLLDRGAIGDVRGATLVYDSQDASDPAEAWRAERRWSGNNTMALGIVYEGVARWLGDALAVQAAARIVRAERPGPRGSIRADVPDELRMLIDFPGDVAATWQMTAYGRAPGATELRLDGTDGALRIDLAARTIERLGVDGGSSVAGPDRDEVARLEPERDWIAAIRDGTPVRWTDFATGMRYMRFTDAVVRAAAEGCRVEI